MPFTYLASEGEMEEPGGFLPLGRRDMFIQPSQQRAIEKVAGHLAREAGAMFVLVITRGGQLLHAWGQHGEVDLPVLSSLAAANMAAGDEIARMIDRHEAFRVVAHEGGRRSLLMCAVNEHLILLLLVPRHEPVGWVRMQMQEAALRLEGIVPNVSAAGAASRMASDDGDLVGLADQALKDLWMG